MLRAAVFVYALVLATMTLCQSEFDLGDPSVGHAQSPLEGRYKHATCRKLGARLSPASPVFYPG
jgi:hypothetical protein